jgi:hypothetical protein
LNSNLCITRRHGIVTRVDEFIISPEKGELLPKQKQLIIFSLTQKDLPSFWEGEINCKITWKQNGGENDSPITGFESNVSMDKPIVNSQELKTDRYLAKTDMLFLRMKKSSNIKVR